ncbi:aromatic ring-hydroxylating dioxygenase subunit alpha [Noviherbaspirillum pedocola]|uniref:Aromatic ring-hydroxylating dioxygenase subunit alpha n=1 Tax=Noviherbaspirillum pedocola TaxID=2801341 RepID=A0A934T461_9BURK|nr:aromatic ring-hydroxylating dioxygenase subunit alpha [Noviherbaspirillum pedocola]MBK4738683.1 aromatic ring-hydroxylating dioxygenase subunit alpha [Noviherbaspirillum pedocola]
MRDKPARTWEEDVTRIPYWVYQDAAVYQAEQSKVFGGPTWSYLCLEAEIPKSGDFRTTFIGEMPVIVVRGNDDEIYSFENRCSHRGALIALEDRGNAEDFTCVYHAWRYDLEGNLKGVAFQNGVNGKGGMPESFCMEAHGPRKLRTTVFCGLVFGSLDEDVPPIEEYLGEEITSRIERVMHKPVQVIGRFKQMLPNNWKLYFENVKDSYHASLLHVFFTTFRINRLSQRGGVIVSEDGGHHVSYSAIDPNAAKDAEYSAEKLRSDKEDYRLADPSLLDGCDEFGDGVTLQILSVFPGFVLQQIQNCLAIRQVLPKGQENTELNWTYFGFEDDTPELRKMRLKQSNLIGAAGFVSMEDGAVGGFVQRGVACAGDEKAIVEMGGAGVESVNYRATETSVRGFWKAYRNLMGL